MSIPKNYTLSNLGTNKHLQNLPKTKKNKWFVVELET